jgi:Integrase core domain
VAQQALDEWVIYYNTARPHQALGDATPAERFQTMPPEPVLGSPSPATDGRGGSQGRREPLPPSGTRDGQGWISRKVGPNGIVCVDWQQVSVGKHRAGSRCDVLVTDQLLQFWIGEELMKTVTRTGSGEVRKKHAQGARPRA